MNIHEFQAKQILSRFGAPVPQGHPAATPDEAAKAFVALGQTEGRRQGPDSCGRAR